jgi:hypothetical protein
VPGVLTWKAVRDGLMPPAGLSLLPESIEKLIPEAFRYWKHEGDEARGIRDALFDLELVTAANVRFVDGVSRLVTTKLFALEPADVDQSLRVMSSNFQSEIASLVKVDCVMWSVDTFPSDFRIEDEQVLIFDPQMTKAWIEKDGADDLARQVSKLQCKFLLAVPDSVAARHALAKAVADCQPFTVQRSAMANLLFLTNAEIAKRHIDLIAPGPVEFDRQETFDLLKQTWDGHELWHLRMGTERWVLQEDPTKSLSLSMLKSIEAPLDGTVEKLDSGRAVYVNDFGDRRRMRLDGAILSGICSFEQAGGSALWKFDRIDSSEPAGGAVAKATYNVREFIIKSEEERFVLGIVLEPEVVDAQKDIYDEKTVRDAAHSFMENFQNIGVMHQALSKDVRILESFIAPVKFEISSRSIRKGTWLLATRVLSDDLWKAVKDGTFGGYSIGGSAIRTPV